VDLERRIVHRTSGAVPAIPSFVAAEVVSSSGCERAFVVSCGSPDMSACSYRCDLQGGQWHMSVIARSSGANRLSDGGGIHVGSPVVCVISHAPLAASPPSNDALARLRGRSCTGAELSLLSCDGSACRSTLVRASMGIQVRSVSTIKCFS